MLDRIDFLNEIEKLADKRREEIRQSCDNVEIKGRTFYVSAEGNDENDGLAPESAWRTLAKVSDAELKRGDGVLFRRGDVFRGMVRAQSGVTYAA